MCSKYQRCCFQVLYHPISIISHVHRIYNVIDLFVPQYSVCVCSKYQRCCFQILCRLIKSCVVCFQGDGKAGNVNDADIGDLDDLLRREREMEKKRKESAPVDAEVRTFAVWYNH